MRCKPHREANPRVSPPAVLGLQLCLASSVSPPHSTEQIPWKSYQSFPSNTSQARRTQDPLFTAYAAHNDNNGVFALETHHLRNHVTEKRGVPQSTPTAAPGSFSLQPSVTAAPHPGLRPRRSVSTPQLLRSCKPRNRSWLCQS